MATKRISELTAITAVTTDDNLIINDGNTATRRITFGNFMSSVAGENTTFAGNITFNGNVTGVSLDDMTDVDLTTAAATDGQVLQYSSSGSKFVPVTLGSGAFSNLAAFAGALGGDVNFATTINTRLETLTGAAAAASNLGTFSGSTISDSRTIKEALQDLETTLEAIDIDTDDLAALTGISENVTNLGTFTGSVISDNTAVKTALQELETSVELKATTATPTFTGHVLSPEFRAAGTGHLKLRAETGNDLNIYLNDTETLQITRDPSTGNPKFTAVGGTGECQFLQSVDLVSGFKVGGVAVSATAAELNYVDGVTSNVQTQLDAKALASAVANVDNTSDADKPISTATQTALDLKATLADPTFTGVLTARDSILRQDTGHAARFLSPAGTDLQLSFRTGITGSGQDALITLDDGNNDFQIRTMQADGDFVVKTNDTEALRVNASAQEVVIGEGKLVLGSTAVSATAAELNYMDGVTSAVQTQIDAKPPIDSPTFTTKIESPEFHSAGSHLKFKAATNDIIFYPNNTETLQITRSGTDCRFTSNGGTGTFKFNQDVTQRPGSSVTPSANGDLSVEATSNTTLTFKLKGDDGVVRSGTITLS